MKSSENEVKDLRERNKELAKKAQYWRVTANKKETEKIELLSENNTLRMKLNKYRSANLAMDRYLQSSVQELSEKTLTQLVDVSTGIAKVIEVMKCHMAKKKDIENTELSPAPRKSNNNVRKVIPMIGGRTTQPSLVLPRLSGALYDSYVNGVAENSNRITGNIQDESGQDESGQDVPEVGREDSVRQTAPNEPYPMQNVFVILDRLNMDQVNNAIIDSESDDFSPSDNEEASGEEDEGDAEGADEGELTAPSRNDTLQVLEEEVEGEREEAEETEIETETRPTLRDVAVVIQRMSPQTLTEHTPQRVAVHSSQAVDNPREGPSWLLDAVPRGPMDSYHDNSSPTFFSSKNQRSRINRAKTKEAPQAPDSTTEAAGPSAEGEETIPRITMGRKRNLARVTFQSDSDSDEDEDWRPRKRAHVRQQKRAEERKDPTSVRVLLSKMNMEAHLQSRVAPTSPGCYPRIGESEGEDTPAQNRFMETETPSPNGSVPHLYISENSLTSEHGASDEECDRRRPRRVVPKNYKEKPLNRKLRRG